MSLPTDPKERKAIPIWKGFFCYFPKAIAAIAQLSFIANEQHKNGPEIFWDKSKSADETDALMRHLDEEAQGIVYDTDGVLMATKVAWRGNARLERLLDSGVAPIQPAGIDRYGKPIVEAGDIVMHTCSAKTRPYASLAVLGCMRDVRSHVLCDACALMDIRFLR